MGLAYGNISNTMDIIKQAKKGKHLNSLEKYTVNTNNINHMAYTS
jgi:hypothetical protein